jgi:HD-like signal output (HDOD) protein
MLGDVVEFQQLLEEAERLEALPHSTVRLSALLSDADWVLKEIVQVVEHDLVLTGKLLKLANASTMAATRPILSVGEAILRVGPGPVLSLALASAVRIELQQPLHAYGLAERELWTHSVAAALAVERTRGICQVTPPPGAFVGGLLHDIGKLILDRHLRQGGAHPPGPEDEQRALGIHHGLVGGLVAAHWKLPVGITEAVAHHHDPAGAQDEPGRIAASFVALADCVAHRVTGREEELPTSDVAQRVGLDLEGFERLCAATRESLEDVLQVYS